MSQTYGVICRKELAYRSQARILVYFLSDQFAQYSASEGPRNNAAQSASLRHGV